MDGEWISASGISGLEKRKTKHHKNHIPNYQFFDYRIYDYHIFD